MLIRLIIMLFRGTGFVVKSAGDVLGSAAVAGAIIAEEKNKNK